MSFKRLPLLFLLFLSFFAKAQRLVNDKVDVQTGAGISYREAVLYFPAGYSEEKTYPLVIFTHGMGEAGSDINLLYRTGLPKVLKNGYRPAFDFIMVAPQHGSFSALSEWIPGVLEDAQQRWNIDTNRVYLTGLSAGGRSLYGSQLSLNPAIASRFAAIVVNAGVTPAAAFTNYTYWQVSKTPLWAVVGEKDKSYVTKNSRLVYEINKLVPGLAKLTLQPGVGHTGWDNVYNGRVKNNGKTMWEWMYQFNRASPTYPDIEGIDPDNEENDGDDNDSTPLRSIKVNIFGGYNPYENNSWNNWNVGTGVRTDITSPYFKYTNNSNSTIKAVLSESSAVVDNGTRYGGIMAPAPVLRYTSYSTRSRTLTISGFTPGKKYDLEFYASRSRKNNATQFSINGVSKRVNTYNNLANKAAFLNVTADAQGTIKVTIKNIYAYNYLNGFKITEAQGSRDDEDEDDEDDEDGDDDNEEDDN